MLLLESSPSASSSDDDDDDDNDCENKPSMELSGELHEYSLSQCNNYLPYSCDGCAGTDARKIGI